MTKKKPLALHKSRSDSALMRSRKMVKTDGWANIYSGQGVQGKDKLLGTSFGRVPRFYEEQLSDLYRGDGVGKRTIDLPTGEMVREWFEVNGDTDGDINKYLETIRAKQRVLEALRWAHLYGGSLAVMLINDGGMLEDPVNEDSIHAIENIKVYDRWRVTWTTNDLYDDPENPKFGELEWYNISPTSTGGLIAPFRVHETRVLRFDGLPVSNKVRAENNNWGDSHFQSVYNDLANLTGSFFASRNIIDDFVQTIIKIDNLQELIAAGNDEVVRQRLAILDLGRHTINTMMLDSREDYAKHASSVAGLSKLLEKFQEMYSSVTEIPMTLLFGQSAKGFNAKDDGSMNKWYDKVAQDQEDEMRPQMERLVKLAMLSSEGPTSGKELPDWSISFNPLKQMSEEETVEMRKKQAETDKIYIDSAVLTPEEVALSRFGGDEYSIETSIEESMHKPGALPEPKPKPGQAPDDDDPSLDAFEKIKKKGITSWDDYHYHPYSVNAKGNGKAKKGTFPFYPGSEETFKITHTHDIIAFRIQPGGTDGHVHEMEYDRSE